MSTFEDTTNDDKTMKKNGCGSPAILIVKMETELTLMTMKCKYEKRISSLNDEINKFNETAKQQSEELVEWKRKYALLEMKVNETAKQMIILKVRMIVSFCLNY